MTISGMTGFAREDGAHGDWTWTIEARSVNGRGLDVKFRGPQGFDGLERAARDAAQSHFQRGQINVTVQARRVEAAGVARVNHEALDYYLKAGRAYVDRDEAAKPSLDGLLTLPGVLGGEAAEDVASIEPVEGALTASLRQALHGLKAARDEEGAALAPVLAGLVDRIETLTVQAEGEAAGQAAHVRERFEKRLADLVGDTTAFEERVVQEAAVLAARADVREELDRLAAHVAAARALLAEDGAVGRRLDFLTQEFMREANTLCSKSATIPLTAIGLDLKAAIEQFREQVQNVE
jgi:uncharacterized protein (TIGR00255 family)